MPGQSQWDGSKLQPVRVPTTFKSSTPISATGNTPIWVPLAGSGRFWRWLGYSIEVTADASKATTAGVLDISFQDVIADLGLHHSVYMPVTPAGGTVLPAGVCYSTGWVNLGGMGIRAAAPETALNVNLTFALATGKVRVRLAGQEER